MQVPLPMRRLARALCAHARKAPAHFRAAALVAVRHDAIYLDRCLRQIEQQGLEAYVIDNDADPETRDILDHYRTTCVRHVERHPYPGYFDWLGILERRNRIVQELDTNWVTFWDTDEIREPPPGFATLRDAFYFADRHGYNAADFDEFVFLPTRREESYVGRDYVAEMRHYYWFRPRPHVRLNAWKCSGQEVDMLTDGGHRVYFEGMRIFPEPFVMRHYLFLSWSHALQKYCAITYSPEELARGWCRERDALTLDSLCLPDPAMMSVYRGDQAWDRSRPLSRHPCFPEPPPNH